jgi:4-carboxymuconolactone decarboxylase
MGETGNGAVDPRRQQGMEVAAVLNNASPEGAFDRLTERFPGGLGELTVDFCFGDIWTRPTFDRKTRSLLVVAALTVLGRPGPLRTHVRGALNHGATKDEVREVFVQMAAYAGFPAAVSAQEVAEEVFREVEMA